MLRDITTRPPWLIFSGFIAALLIQLNPDWRARLIFERSGLEAHEFWRAWTGHWVHFGWPHFIADAGLFLILGYLLREHRIFTRLALVLMPLFVSAVIYYFDPTMQRYAGLSALNLGLLLYLAVQGWQKKWTDWFWPAVLLVYVGEAVLEMVKGGRGGGMIQFDDPTVKVATSGHLASAAYALIAWMISRWGKLARNSS